MVANTVDLSAKVFQFISNAIAFNWVVPKNICDI